MRTSGGACKGLRAITLFVQKKEKERKTKGFEAEKLHFNWKCGFVDIRYLCTNSHPPGARRILSCDTWNPLLSVHNLNILFLHTSCINNALLHSSLSRMKTELPCSTHSSSAIRDMSFPIPNPPLNRRGKLQLFSCFYIKKQHVSAPLRFRVGS